MKDEGRTQMRLLGFSFKTEAIWMLIFALGPAIVGLLIVLVVLGGNPCADQHHNSKSTIKIKNFLYSGGIIEDSVSAQRRATR
jgi:hypothetical protein